jgi:hypothetical protein
MNIRALMIAAFGSVVILAGSLTPTPTPLPIQAPVPIATWVAQGIPSDLVVTYHYDVSLLDGQDDIRITADGSATYRTPSKLPGQFAGKLSPDALKRVISACEEKRFFYNVG